MHSAEKSDYASSAQSLCGIALKNGYHEHGFAKLGIRLKSRAVSMKRLPFFRRRTVLMNLSLGRILTHNDSETERKIIMKDINYNNMNMKSLDFLQNDTAEKNSNLILTLAALSGAVGAAAVGINVTGMNAESLSQLAAVAVPGLTAWLISCLISQSGSQVSGE